MFEQGVDEPAPGEPFFLGERAWRKRGLVGESLCRRPSVGESRRGKLGAHALPRRRRKRQLRQGRARILLALCRDLLNGLRLLRRQSPDLLAAGAVMLGDRTETLRDEDVATLRFSFL